MKWIVSEQGVISKYISLFSSPGNEMTGLPTSEVNLFWNRLVIEAQHDNHI